MEVMVHDSANPHNPQPPRDFGSSGFTIGRAENADLRLNSQFVSSIHARVDQHNRGWILKVESAADSILVTTGDGTANSVDREVLGGTEYPLFTKGKFEELLVASRFHVRLTRKDSENPDPDEDVERKLREIHKALLNRLEVHLQKGQLTGELSPQLVEKVMAIIDDLIGEKGEFADACFNIRTLRDGFVMRALKHRLLEHLVPAIRKKNERAAATNTFIESQIREMVVQGAVKLALGGTAETFESDNQRIVALPPAMVEAFLQAAGRPLVQYLISQYVKKILSDISFDYGPLTDLLKIPGVSEIMVVNPKCIYIERNGNLLLTMATFFDNETAMMIIERIISPLGRRIDRSQPLVDARLLDGSRVNAIIPPVAVKGPSLTIRRFPETKVTGEDLLSRGSFTRATWTLLRAMVVARKNIIVVGGTGSGKTTLLNALSGLIPRTERIVTVEDAAELRIDSPHVVTLEAKPPNAEGTGAITIRDLVKNALRMRPDRIIVGECRGSETLDMLQAMNTGHPGSMTTIHANGVEDVVARLETMVLLATEMPLAAIRRQIAQALDVIVFIERSGSRRLVSVIAEVEGISNATGEVRVTPLMARTDEGDLMLTGRMPKFLDDLVRQGGLVLTDWFE